MIKPQSEGGKSGITQQEAVRLAQKAAMEKDHWTDAEVGDVQFDSSTGRWSVFLIRLPHEVGGHALFEVSAKDGTVTKRARGM